MFIYLKIANKQKVCQIRSKEKIIIIIIIINKMSIFESILFLFFVILTKKFNQMKDIFVGNIQKEKSIGLNKKVKRY